MTEPWREEAERGWHEAGRRARLPSVPERGLLVAVAFALSVTFTLLAMRLSQAVDASGAVIAAGGLLALFFVIAPWLAWRRAVRRAEVTIAAVRERRVGHRCPRCGAPLLARDASEAGERDCGGCGARLLEAHGLLITYASDPHIRALRWRGGARARFARRSAPWTLAGASWVAAGLVGIGALWGLTAALAPTGSLRAPLGVVHETPSAEGPREGTASARADRDAPPPGRPTRPFAPLYVGTQVLARQGVGSPWHQLAVIVRAQGSRAFVVFADGRSDWIDRRGALAPELAAGDVVQVWDGARHRDARVLERVGPALRVHGLEAEWTSVARVRVRVDADHIGGEGRRYDIPPGAWVDARDGEVWRPGLAVESSDGLLRIALSDGDERWLDEEHIRAQQLGPGARVYIDGQPEAWIIAARIGHALSVVDPVGAHAWTSLARVRRR